MYDFMRKLGGSRPTTPVQSSTPAPFPMNSVKSKLKGWSSRASSPVAMFPTKGKFITPPATPRPETPRTPTMRSRELPNVGKTPLHIRGPTPAPPAGAKQKRERRSSSGDRGASDTEILKPRPLRVMRRPSILGRPIMLVDDPPSMPKSAPTPGPPILPPPQTQHRTRVRSSPAPPPPPPVQAPVLPMFAPAAAAPPHLYYYDRARSTEPIPARQERRERDRSREHRRAASYGTATSNSPRFGQLNLHWSLLDRRAAPGKPIMWFDIRFEAYNIHFEDPGLRPRPLKIEERNKLAVDRSITTMTIVVPEYPKWPVRVTNSRGITCMDVWAAVFDTFNEPISPEDWRRGYVNKPLVDRCHPAFERRCRAADRTKPVVGYEARQGMRRVDLLDGRTIFGGLNVVTPSRPLAPGECELQLVLKWPHPGMPSYE